MKQRFKEIIKVVNRSFCISDCSASCSSCSEYIQASPTRFCVGLYIQDIIDLCTHNKESIESLRNVAKKNQ